MEQGNSFDVLLSSATDEEIFAELDRRQAETKAAIADTQAKINEIRASIKALKNETDLRD